MRRIAQRQQRLGERARAAPGPDQDAADQSQTGEEIAEQQRQQFVQQCARMTFEDKFERLRSHLAVAFEQPYDAGFVQAEPGAGLSRWRAASAQLYRAQTELLRQRSQQRFQIELADGDAFGGAGIGEGDTVIDRPESASVARTGQRMARFAIGQDATEFVAFAVAIGQFAAAGKQLAVDVAQCNAVGGGYRERIVLQKRSGIGGAPAGVEYCRGEHGGAGELRNRARDDAYRLLQAFPRDLAFVSQRRPGRLLFSPVDDGDGNQRHQRDGKQRQAGCAQHEGVSQAAVAPAPQSCGIESSQHVMVAERRARIRLLRRRRSGP